MSEAEAVTDESGLGFRRVVRRIWRITAVSDNPLIRFAVSAVAMILVVLACTVVAIRIVLSAVLAAPWRLPRDERSDPGTAVM